MIWLGFKNCIGNVYIRHKYWVARHDWTRKMGLVQVPFRRLHVGPWKTALYSMCIIQKKNEGVGQKKMQKKQNGTKTT